MNATKITGKQAESMSGWDIARACGCHYDGDCSPIPHGGYFYNARDWVDCGYANAVEIYVDEDEVVHVTQGSIHRPDDPSDMVRAFESCGIDADDADVWQNANAQIEICRSYDGIEPHHYFAGRSFAGRSFPLATWKEKRIWEKILPWIQRLGE